MNDKLSRWYELGRKEDELWRERNVLINRRLDFGEDLQDRIDALARRAGMIARLRQRLYSEIYDDPTYVPPTIRTPEEEDEYEYRSLQEQRYSL